jgi:hypothetical protein
VRRLIEPAPLARLLERADIAPLVDGFDPAAWLADRSNVALIEGDSIALFERTRGDLYEAHWVFTARGAEALAIARLAMNAMFDMFGAAAIWGKTPMHCRAARLFNRMLGCRSHGVLETVRGPHELFIMEQTL